MLTFLFYSFTMLFVAMELLWILDPKTMTNNHKKRMEKFEDDSVENKITFDALYSVTLLIWIVGGLVSYSWPLFIFFILSQIFIHIIGIPVKKYESLWIFIHWTNSVIGFAFGVFIIINKFHLRIDLYKLFL